MFEKLNPENYYDDYRGRDLSLLYGRMKGMDLPRELLDSIREKEAARFLILGSAVTDNLNQVALIDQYLRPGKVENDEVVVIDRNEYPVSRHKKESDWIEGADSWTNTPKSTLEFSYPKFHIAQADMRHLPFAENGFDAVISDYTFNYLDNIEDVEKTFLEISQALPDNGLLVISVMGNEKFPYSGEADSESFGAELQNKDQGGVEVYFFPLQAYINLARKHGLYLAKYDLIGNDMCAVLVKK
ncbi:MAG: class I SAM-dependent methyltransferase [Candidatus Paceibacterota bacterium]